MALNFSLCPLAAWYVIVRLYFGSRETALRSREIVFKFGCRNSVNIIEYIFQLFLGTRRNVKGQFHG